MLKFRKFFYDKTKITLERELAETGLNVIDEDRFHQRVISASRKDMIYTFILIIFVIVLLIKWIT